MCRFGWSIDRYREPRHGIVSNLFGKLHDLVLRQPSMRVSLHAISAASRIEVADEAQAQRTATVLITLEFGNRGFCSVCRVKPHNASTTRAPAGLVLDLGLFNLSNSSE